MNIYQIKILVNKLNHLTGGWSFYYSISFMLNTWKDRVFFRRVDRRVQLFPSVETVDDFNVVYRANYYFSHLPEIRLVYHSSVDESECKLPDYFTVEYTQRDSLNEKVSRFSIILGLFLCRPTILWKGGLLAKYLAILPWIENIDIEMNPNEGWRFIELYNRLGGEKTRAYDGFSKVSDEVVVLGTGPSLDLAETIDISDKVVIACNTMIKNKELMGRVKPDYLVFADAIYHFGPSTYAAAFRGAFKEFVDSNPQCVVLLPQIFYGFFVEVIGQEYAKNVFSIPEAGHRNVVVDLAQEPSLHRFENILNKMLVPLACTFGRKVYFLGFDGRAKTDKGFWSHSVKNNFVELLPVQEKAHPSFFRKKSYKAYAEHQETVTEMIFAKAEENGNELICLAESNNSAMAKRFDPSLIFEN